MSDVIIVVRDYKTIIDSYDEWLLEPWNLGILSTQWQTYIRCDRSHKGMQFHTLLHRLIMNPPRTKQIDHIDGDTMNNRRSNLRIATPTQNQQNRQYGYGYSDYKGVNLNMGLWRAKITVNKKQVHLGYFATEEAAALAYDEAALNYFGEFAKTNFPFEVEIGYGPTWADCK
jgi:HNH endonuclease